MSILRADVISGAVGCRCQHLEPQGTLQLTHPVRGCRHRPDTREAGIDQDDQSVQARMQAVLLLDQLDELDAGVGVGRLDTVVRQEVEVATGVGAVPDDRQEQRGLLSRRRPERLLDRGPGLDDRRVDQQAPGSRVGAAPHLGVGHHRVQIHRRLGQERQGRQARALRADNQDSPIAGDRAHRGPLPWLSRSREHIIPLRVRDAAGPRPGTAGPGEGRSEANCLTSGCKSRRRRSPCGAVVISGSRRGDSWAGSPDVQAPGGQVGFDHLGRVSTEGKQSGGP